MKFLSLLLLSLFCFTAQAGFEGLNQGASLKLFNRLDCGAGVSCSKVKDKFVVATGLSSRVAATATTVTASQCGSTFYNTGAVVINLPDAGLVLGCRLTFITLNAAAFNINPDTADTILVMTNAAGDSISNATLGNSVTIEAASASQWAAISIQGTWTDAN